MQKNAAQGLNAHLPARRTTLDHDVTLKLRTARRPSRNVQTNLDDPSNLAPSFVKRYSTDNADLRFMHYLVVEDVEYTP